MRAEDDASAPIGGESSVVVGVEVGEEVRDGEIAGVAERVDEEAGFGDDFGMRKAAGDRWERETEGRRGLWGLQRERVVSVEVES